MPMIAPLPRHPLQESRGSRVERQQRDDKILETIQSRRAAALIRLECLSRDHLQVLHDLARSPAASTRHSSESAETQASIQITKANTSQRQARLRPARQTAQPESLNSDRYLPPLQQLHGLPRQQLHRAQDHQDQIAVPTEAQPSTDHTFSSTTSFHTWDSDGINWDDVVSWGSLDV